MRQRRGSDELGLGRPATDAPQRPPERPEVKVTVAVDQLADDGEGESHDDLTARLQREHGRKYSF